MLIIKSDGTEIESVPANGTDYSLKELQEIVEGYIEVVRLKHELYDMMIINEEGKLNRLPVNLKATRIFKSTQQTFDYIVGNVLLCKSKHIK